jgi:hypothetical protein
MVTDSSEPLGLRLEHDGTGSASFEWQQVLATITSGLAMHVAEAIGRGAVIVGVRFVDADGREATGPAPTGLTLVGFTTTHE